MNFVTHKIQALRDWFDRLSPRERTMVSALGVSFLLMVTLIVGFLVVDGLSTMEGRNADMRQALRDLDTQRDAYLRAKAKTAQLESRLGHNSVQLSGFLESAAKEAGVQIPDETEKPVTPAGKQYVERSISLVLRSVTIEALGKFMRKIETGPNLIAITALNVRTRDDKHQELDVEMTVSTWEHAKPGAIKKDKEKEKGEKT